MSESLKPVCCGCGGEPVVGHIEKTSYLPKDRWYIGCPKCDICTGLYDTEAEAIEAWNRRVATDMNVGDKETVIIEPFTTDMNHVGYCKCGYLVNAEWKYCPNCGAKLEWK
jgi:hypothetical protein